MEGSERAGNGGGHAGGCHGHWLRVWTGHLRAAGSAGQPRELRVRRESWRPNRPRAVAPEFADLVAGASLQRDFG